MSWMPLLFGKSREASRVASVQTTDLVELEALVGEFPSLSYMTPKDLANEMRVLVGLQVAVMQMGLDPEKLAAYANANGDFVSKTILFKCVTLNDDALRTEGVSESGVMAAHSVFDRLRLPTTVSSRPRYGMTDFPEPAGIRSVDLDRVKDAEKRP